MQRFKKFLMESIEFPGEGEKRKPIVRPSPVSVDPAQRAGELSNEFAAFPEQMHELWDISDEELIKKFEPYVERYKQSDPYYAQRWIDIETSDDPFKSGQQFGKTRNQMKADEIRWIIDREVNKLQRPNFSLTHDPTSWGSKKFWGLLPARSSTDKEVKFYREVRNTVPETFWQIPTRPTEGQSPVPHRWRHSHEYRTVEAPKYGRLMQKGAEVAGKVSSLIDPISKAAESAAGKILPAAGAVASMYGLADTLFGKEASAPPTMMEPERQEQEEQDELLAAAMNPQNNPVAGRAPVELKRSEWRRKAK